MEREIKLEIEELEELIAPGMPGFVPPADGCLPFGLDFPPGDGPPGSPGTGPGTVGHGPPDPVPPFGLPGSL